jgi:hypothetical protein
MFFFETSLIFLLTFELAMAYTDSVESKRLTEAMVIAKLTEWLNTLRPLLESSNFKGVIRLVLL